MPNKSGYLGLKIAAGLAVLVAAGAVGFYYSRPMAKIVPVTAGVAPNAVPGTVAVIAVRQAPITSEIGGRVLRSTLEVGKKFKAGDPMLQIDTGDLDLEIKRIEIDSKALQEKIDLGSALQTKLDNAKDELQVKQRSFDLKTLSQMDLTKQQREVESLEQEIKREKVDSRKQLDTLENTLATLRRKREKMAIAAPFDGIVDKVFAHERDLIAGNSPIATYISLDRYVEARISEENFAGIKVGNDAVVHFLSYDKNYDAKVSEKLPTADSETQRYTVRLNVQIPAENLLPGLTGEVSIVVDKHNSQTIVPIRAVKEKQLFVVKDGRVELRNVQLGFTSYNMAEIVSGVSPKEYVIAEDLDLFHAGQHVRTKILEE